MKLLLDENLSPQLAATLRARGYDATSVVECGMAGAPDERVRAFAIESGRILTTLDADFADMLRFPPAGTPGVIRLKIHPPTEEAIRHRLIRVLKALDGQALADCLVVSHRDIIRIRS